MCYQRHRARHCDVCLQIKDAQDLRNIWKATRYMPRVTTFYHRSFRFLFQSTHAIQLKNQGMLGMHPHKNSHQMTTDLTKLKTYQSLLFFPAYLFSLEDLKRRWWIVTFPLEITLRVSFVWM